MLTLKHQAVSSVRWNALSQVFKLSLYFLTSILLARLLQPDDFGLLGMATVFTSLVAVFNDFGLGSAVIQNVDMDDQTLSGVFWMSAAIGLLAMGVTILFAPWIAAFYHQVKLQALLTLLSTSFLLTALGQVQLSLLMKQINFKQIAVIESLAALLGGVVAVVMAFLNYGVWCLAVQIIITSGVTTLILWMKSRWRPGIRFEFGRLRGILNYSSGLFGFNLLNYFSRNADYLLIGKFLGAAPLGLYTFAYRLMQYPMQSIAGVVNRVLFPTLTQVKNNNEQFRNGYIRASQLIATVTFPIMVGVLCLAPELTVVVFGSKWQPAIPVVQVLALVGLLQSIGGMVGNIYTAKGNTKRLFFWGVFSSIITVGGIAIGLRWGILGVGIGYACASLLLFYPSLAVPFHLIDLRVTDYLWSLRKQTVIAVLMGLVLFASASLQRLAGRSQSLILIGNLLLGGVIYLAALIRFDRGTLIELLNAVLGNSAAKVIRFLKL